MDGSSPSLDGLLRLNHLQLLATHNSYHVAPADPLVPDWDYTREPLDEQLDVFGVRGFELDTHFVPAESDDIAVYHVPNLDDGTNCGTFAECLAVLRAWSDSNRGHHPLFVQIEPKDDEFSNPIDFSAYADRMDEVILEVWQRNRIVTPDDVRGDAETLREAIVTEGWPTLGEARDKVLFFLNERAQFHEAYTRGGDDLSGRLAFPESTPDESFAAIIVMNTPSDEVTAVVEQGFIVRTRADGFPRPDDAPARRERALSTGAQILSTDFLAPDGDDSGFSIPEGTPSRCNPVTAPPECTAQAIESL